MKEDGIITTPQAIEAAQAEQLSSSRHQPRPRATPASTCVDEIGREAQRGRRHRQPDRAVLRGALDHPPGAAARRRGRAAGGAGAIRAERRPRRVPRRRDEPRRRDPQARRRSEDRPEQADLAAALEQARLPLYDVHWTPAVVVEKSTLQGRRRIDPRRPARRPHRCRCRPAAAGRARRLNLYDVVYVKVDRERHEAQQAQRRPRVELRIRPTVQGAAVVLENKTGRILAMVGGFSYPLSQLNRATQSRRQPGSSLKPLTYLAALNSGLQPNTLVHDAPITYPPIGGATATRAPRTGGRRSNYDGGSSGTMTLRRALEHSKNLVDRAAARRRHRATRRSESLDEICRLAMEAQLYPQCERYYPFVLGAQPVRPIDLAGFYAAIANEGGRPTPHVIESDRAGRPTSSTQRQRSRRRLPGVDRAGGVPAPHASCKAWWRAAPRRAIGALSPSSAARPAPATNSTTPGSSASATTSPSRSGSATTTPGASARSATARPARKVALPIFEPIMQAVWANVRAADCRCPAPRREAARQLVALPIDVQIRASAAMRRSARRLHGIFPARRRRPPHRHAVPAGVARLRLYGSDGDGRQLRHCRGSSAASPRAITTARRMRGDAARRRAASWRPPAGRPALPAADARSRDATQPAASASAPRRNGSRRDAGCSRRATTGLPPPGARRADAGLFAPGTAGPAAFDTTLPIVSPFRSGTA